LPEAVTAPAGERHVACTVRGRTFAYLLDDHHGDGRLAVNLKAAAGRNAELIDADPDACFMPSYLGARGWVGVRLDAAEVDWALVEDLMRDSFRLVAPRRLAGEAG
jgi:phosphoribosylglycinamide formyltransferase-1